MLNVDTTERLLGANPPELARAKEVLVDIRQANQHATEIIQHLEDTSEAEETRSSLRNSISMERSRMHCTYFRPRPRSEA